MKLSVLRERQEARSSKLSELARQLSLGGLALVWLFRTGEGPNVRIPAILVRAALIFVIALAADALQYLYAYIVLNRLHRHFEKKEFAKPNPDPDPEVVIDRHWNWPTIVLFGAKLVAVGMGFYLVLAFLWARAF